MSILASQLLGTNKKRDQIVLELREFLETHGGPNWRTNPEDLPIKFSGITKTTILVDVTKADNAWKAPKSVNFRISNTGDNEIGDRTRQLVDYIKGGNPLDPSHAYYDPERKSLDFGDGRHRFALLRDAGVLCVPINTDSPESLLHLEAKEEELQETLKKVLTKENSVQGQKMQSETKVARPKKTTQSPLLPVC